MHHTTPEQHYVLSDVELAELYQNGGPDDALALAVLDIHILTDSNPEAADILYRLTLRHVVNLAAEFDI